MEKSKLIIPEDLQLVSEDNHLGIILVDSITHDSIAEVRLGYYENDKQETLSDEIVLGRAEYIKKAVNNYKEMEKLLLLVWNSLDIGVSIESTNAKERIGSLLTKLNS